MGSKKKRDMFNAIKEEGREMRREGSKTDKEKGMRENQIGGGRVKQGRMRRRENGTAGKVTREGEIK